jgi:hypothetical protein
MTTFSEFLPDLNDSMFGLAFLKVLPADSCLPCFDPCFEISAYWAIVVKAHLVGGALSERSDDFYQISLCDFCFLLHDP